MTIKDGNWGVGMPAALWLEEFGSQVWATFGSPPYLVGSVMKSKRGWRDVDVRVILDDKEWKLWGFGEPDEGSCHHNGKWVALCMAFSELGRKMTGLPIDFQIQQQTYANKHYGRQHGHVRSSLGHVDLRYARKR